MSTAFLVFNPVYAAWFLRNSLKLPRSFVIIGLDLFRSISGKVPKQAAMPCMKLNKKYELNQVFLEGG